VRNQKKGNPSIKGEKKEKETEKRENLLWERAKFLGARFTKQGGEV